MLLDKLTPDGWALIDPAAPDPARLVLMSKWDEGWQVLVVFEGSARIPREVPDTLTATVEVATPLLNTTIQHSVLRVWATQPVTTSFRIRLTGSGGTTAYLSPWIQTEVIPDDIRKMTIRTSDGQLFHSEWWGSREVQAHFLQRGEDYNPLLITFSDRHGELSDAALGPSAQVEVTSTRPDVARVTLVSGRPFAFRLEALAPGLAEVRVKLLQEGRVTWTRAKGMTIQVLGPQSSHWVPFPEDEAPDGEVRCLAVYRDRLVVAGAFTRVGSLPAAGIACWDGSGWSAAMSPLREVSALLSDGQVLLAEVRDGRFFRWTGDTWIDDAVSDGRSSPVLYHGELLMVGRSAPIEVWRSGSWQPFASVPDRCYALAASGDLLYAAVETHPGTMFYGSAVYLVDQGGASLVWDLGDSDDNSPFVSHLKAIGSDLVAGAYSYGISFWRPDAGRRLVTSTGMEVRGSTEIADRLYIADGRSIFVDEGIGLRRCADVGGTWVVNTMESFGGALYLGGSFSEVDGTPSPYLARWVP